MTVDIPLAALLVEKPRWQMLKQNKTSAVYKVPLDADRWAIAKEFSLAKAIKRLGFQRKCRRIQAFYRAAGRQPVMERVDLPALLSSGVSRNSTVNGYLIYAWVPGLDLRHVRWDIFPPEALERIGREIGRALYRIHAINWVHGDFKFANVMLNRADGDSAAISIVDLESVSKIGPLLRTKPARDMARFLLNGLEVDAPMALLTGFWQSYCAGFAGNRERAIARQTRRWLEQLRARHVREGRAAVELERLVFLRAGAAPAFNAASSQRDVHASAESATQSTYAPIAAALLGRGELPLGSTVVPSSTHTHVARITVAGEAQYLKVFRFRSLADRLKQQLRGTRAERSRRAAVDLAQAGISTPDVIARGTLREGSWLVTRAVPAVSLGAYIDNTLRGRLEAEQLHAKRQLIRALGGLVGRLHKAGIAHGDLRLNNILVESADSAPHFYLVDNERNAHYPRLPPFRLRVKNLVQVSLIFPPFATRSDWLRFYRAYCAQLPEMSAGERRKIANRVREKSAQRLSRLAQKPLSSPLSAQ